MEEKQLRLGHVTWLDTHARRAFFLVTRASPPLYFLPAVMCAATEAALGARQGECEAEAQAAAARLEAALASAAEAAAAKEAELRGNKPREAAAEAEDAADPDDAPGEPLEEARKRREAEEAAEDADDAAMDGPDEEPLAGVLQDADM